MELILLGAILVAAMATVDIPESREDADDLATNRLNQGQKPYGVRG